MQPLSATSFHPENRVGTPPSSESFRPQYPASIPRSFHVEVAPDVSLYVEEYGNPAGIPVVFFHGGPGIRFKSTDHQWFNPEKYRIIMPQQRGTWGCTPSAYDFYVPASTFQEVRIETLAEDMEALRKALNINQWLVFGGSWGSTLATFYGQEYPSSCLGLVLRGIFLATPKENALFLDRERHRRQCGERWKDQALDRLVDYARLKGFDLSFEDTPSIYAAYRELSVLQDDRIAQRIWAAFEEFVDEPTEENFAILMDDDPERTTEEQRSIGIWETLLMDSVSREHNLLAPENLKKLSGVPIEIVQGKEDKLCHHSIAQELVDGLSQAGCKVEYALIEGGGHSPYHVGMTDALVRACDCFAETASFCTEANLLGL